MKKLSVIIPAHNESKRIKATLVDVDAYLKRQNYDYEIIVVDNRSTDNTIEVVKALESTMKNATVIEQSIAGKGAAVKLGMQKAQGEYAMFMDADNATPISEITKFWPKLEAGSAVVIGSRYLDDMHKAKQPWFRTILSKVSIVLVETVLMIPGIHDTQAGFKVFKTEAAKRIFNKITIFGWAFDMEILLIAHKYGYKIAEAPIKREEHGGSTVPASAYLQSLRDLFRIRLNDILGKYSEK